MIEYDSLNKKMILKLVYYGPALSGKTTNLLPLHESLQQEGRSDLMVLDTRKDRTIFFDLLPLSLVASSGLKKTGKPVSLAGRSAPCLTVECRKG